MKTSTIQRGSGKKVAVLREDYLEICQGDIGAALLLSFFEYWHNVKVSMVGKSKKLNNTAESYGDARGNDETCLQFHTKQELYDGMMGLVGMKSIAKGRDLLVKLGFITLHKNPNPRYKFDKTQFFLLHPDSVNLTLSIGQKDTTVMSKGHDGDVKRTPTRTVTTSVTTTVSKEPPTVPHAHSLKSNGFDKFWTSYPNKKAKVNAEKAWAKINPDEELQKTIMLALKQHNLSDDWQKDGGKYIPHPASWLNAKRWEDEIDSDSDVNPEMMMDY